MTALPEVEAYLAALREDQRRALEDLRAVIHAAAPDATEVITYSVPGFRHYGVLCSYGAAKKHCSFFVMSPVVIEAHRDALAGYDTSKGTVRFLPEKPLPAALVQKLVRARVAENEALRKKK